MNTSTIWIYKRAEGLFLLRKKLIIEHHFDSLKARVGELQLEKD